MMKKAQAWGFDLIIAASIFLIGVIFFYVFALNYSSTDKDFNELYSEGEFIADSILSEGYPLNWNETNVVRIGILSGEKINKTKLEQFYNISTKKYGFSKSLFNLKDNYYINLSKSINISGKEVYGFGTQSENPKNLVVVSRIAPYENEILNLKIEVWN